MPAPESPTLPLHLFHVEKSTAIANRLHIFFHSIALASLLYYRASHIFQETRIRDIPLLPWLLVFAAELSLCFMWILNQACRWRPVSRTVFPERLPGDEKLPEIDVLICTADPDKEPIWGVMNTVVSALGLDYPPEKLNVYLSDDGGSDGTLCAMREALVFARWWLPFCRTFGIKTRCPEAYFSDSEVDTGTFRGSDFMEERDNVKEKYELFKKEVEAASRSGETGDGNFRDHPPVVEVIQDDYSDKVGSDHPKLPLLVYVAREKRPSEPHYFKAGALNALLRVSGIISNSPYILVLDCDMYCNDPSSARKAMCFHLDPSLSRSLALVQFPQKFHNICKNDIYGSALRYIFKTSWQGMDGLLGPILSGTCVYLKREPLYGDFPIKDMNLLELQQKFGPSNEFMKSVNGTNNSKSCLKDYQDCSSTLIRETMKLASCTYESQTKWGKEIGFLYHSVVEDYSTGFSLHCRGYTSVYYDPSRPHFLGSATTNLNDVLVQGTRWYTGLLENGVSRFCPLIYGPLRMSILESMCYAAMAFFPLYCFPLWCLSTIPQLSLLHGVPVYPKVSNFYFLVFSFIFLSSLLKHLHEVIVTGGSVPIWINELRMWMIRSITSSSYGTLDVLLKKIGIRESSFLPTNKVMTEEQAKIYQSGKFDFQTSSIFLVPMVSVVILNAVSLVIGSVRLSCSVGSFDEMFAQLFFCLFILIVSYPIIEGIIKRKDKGSISREVVVQSTLISLAMFCLGFVFLN